jgi:hypothetical protein
VLGEGCGSGSAGGGGVSRGRFLQARGGGFLPKLNPHTRTLCVSLSIIKHSCSRLGKIPRWLFLSCAGAQSCSK